MRDRPLLIIGVLLVALLTAGLSRSLDADDGSQDGGAKTAATAPGAPAPHVELPPPRPELRDPEVLSVTDGRLKLADDQDYVLELPCTPVEVDGGLRISGGRNVLLVGGTVVLPDDGERGRGLYLVDQTGTVHIEGLHLTGNLGEGINLSQSKGAVVHLVNVRIDAVQGSQDTNHADLLQIWAGPRELRIDGFVGASSYQGFFLLPNQHYDGPPPERFTLRDVHITMAAGSGYALWTEDGRAGFPVDVQDMWVTLSGDEPTRDRDSLLWPQPSDTGDETWEAVQIGSPEADVLSAEAGSGYAREDARCS